MVEITPHALRRFRERYLKEEKCSKQLALELLMAAYLESKPPPKYIRRKYPGIKNLHRNGRVALYHKYSGLLLLCSAGETFPHCIVTVIHLPFPEHDTWTASNAPTEDCQASTPA